MNDIFISYANEDRVRADLIAQALQKHGWSVWWDRKIPIGKSFEEVIESQISSAKCVMVLWSKYSIKSHWVREEANDGQSRNILAPVLLDEITIPLGFKRIQAANFINWSGDAYEQVFINLVEDIRNIIGNDRVNNNSAIVIKSMDIPEQRGSKDTGSSTQHNILTDIKPSTNIQEAKTTFIDQVNENLLSFSEVYCHTSQSKNSFEEGQLIINSDSIQYISAIKKVIITSVQQIYFQLISEGSNYNYMIVEHQTGNDTEKLMFSIYSFWGGEPTKNMYQKVYDLYTNKKLPYVGEMKPFC